MAARRKKVSAVAPLIQVFSGLKDPRSTKSRKHPLVNIIVIAICSCLCGADNWVATELWAKSNRKWLAGFLNMSTGVPSHDTLGRVFSILEPTAFQNAFAMWVQGLEVDVEGKVIAIDGKTLRRSHDRAKGNNAIHVVNAWCTEVGIALGQVKTEQKSNEITAIPELLEMLKLDGAIITTDAMGCQRSIAEAIRGKNGDYLLAVKDNHPTLCREIKANFDAVTDAPTPHPELRTHYRSERGHGREEERTTYVLPIPESLHGKDDWKDLRSIAMVESVRAIDGKSSTFHRFYVSSLTATQADIVHRAARAHWGVENGLHWVLDVAFREDECRVRAGHAAENLARIRQIALNLLKQDRTLRVGINNKRLRAGWDEEYLRHLLGLQRVDNAALGANE